MAEPDPDLSCESADTVGAKHCSPLLFPTLWSNEIARGWLPWRSPEHRSCALNPATWPSCASRIDAREADIVSLFVQKSRCRVCRVPGNKRGLAKSDSYRVGKPEQASPLLSRQPMASYSRRERIQSHSPSSGDIVAQDCGRHFFTPCSKRRGLGTAPDGRKCLFWLFLLAGAGIHRPEQRRRPHERMGRLSGRQVPALDRSRGRFRLALRRARLYRVRRLLLRSQEVSAECEPPHHPVRPTRFDLF